jgi:hypothetical protein
MPKELERTPGTGCDQRRISGGAALQCSSARSRTACSRFARAQILGRQVDLAGRHLERLSDIPLVGDRELDRVHAGRAVHLDLHVADRRGQGNPDHRDPACAVADDEGSMPVGLDTWRDVAGGREPQELDAAGHRALAR